MAFMIQSLEDPPPPLPHNVLVLTLLYILHFFQALCEQFAASKDITNHRHCFLSFGALVHKINQRSNLQQDTKTITTCQQRIKVLNTIHCIH